MLIACGRGETGACRRKGGCSRPSVQQPPSVTVSNWSPICWNVDALEQQTSIDDVEDREDDLTQLPTEVDPADAVDQHRGLGGDDTDDYPRD